MNVFLVLEDVLNLVIWSFDIGRYDMCNKCFF